MAASRMRNITHIYGRITEISAS